MFEHEGHNQTPQEELIGTHEKPLLAVEKKLTEIAGSYTHGELVETDAVELADKISGELQLELDNTKFENVTNMKITKTARDIENTDKAEPVLRINYELLAKDGSDYSGEVDIPIKLH